jgi:EF-P beta-lysylation protein EpmB
MPYLPKIPEAVAPKVTIAGVPGSKSDNGTISNPESNNREWQKDMQKAFRRLDALLDYVHLDANNAPFPLALDPTFPILVTTSFADSMKKGDWLDPLLLQILPLGSEENPSLGFQNDAVGDLPAQIIPGLLHKYASRALLMVSPNCAIHCRYCFRREFPYADLPHGQQAWEPAWEYLKTAQGIDEIVFSGGDPLFLDNRRLQSLLQAATALPNIHTIRFHTRLPIVLPSRMDARLLELFKITAAKKTLVIVIHANHSHELGELAAGALSLLRASGAMLLNQTVLLKDVNDNADTLVKLSQRLIHLGVLPYYLHQLDRVTGTAHFEVAESLGLELMEEMRRRLPGYAIPKYVREVAGQKYKSALN